MVRSRPPLKPTARTVAAELRQAALVQTVNLVGAKRAVIDEHVVEVTPCAAFVLLNLNCAPVRSGVSVNTAFPYSAR